MRISGGIGVMDMNKHSDVTLKELIKILAENKLEFYIKKQKDNIVKIHFMVKEE